MKTVVLLAISTVLMSVLFCPMVTAFPAVPADLQVVQPDPSLPKELSPFLGKWESAKHFLIVQKIDAEKATLYFRGKGNFPDNPDFGWRSWIRAQVTKEKQQYILYYVSQSAERGEVKLYFKDDLLIQSDKTGSERYKRVP